VAPVTRFDPEIVIADRAFLAEVVAAEVRTEARDALSRNGRFTIAIPGGSVAEAFLPRLARVPLDPTTVEVLWVDERAVSADDPESNARLGRTLWLDPGGFPCERVHAMPGDAHDLEAAAREYEQLIGALAGSPPHLDLVLLGVGEDGHVASLFPGHAALLEGQRAVMVVTDSPKAPPRRLTLTLPVLANAERVIVAAFGESKAEAMRAALDPTSDLPVARVIRGAKRSLVLLDPAAGAGLLSSS
jgi:6-phosphogluconolactonase